MDGLGNLAATDPEELPAFEVTVRAGVEGIASVDEGEGEVAFLGEEFRNEQSHALIGLRGDDFVDAASFEGEAGGGLGFFGKRSRTMRGGEFFAKFPAEFIDFQKRRHMFIRTLFCEWSSGDVSFDFFTADLANGHGPFLGL